MGASADLWNSLSLCSSFFSSTLFMSSSYLFLRLSAQHPNLGSPPGYTWISFFTLQPINKVSQGDCKVYFICFPFLRNDCPLLLDIQCLENHCFIYLSPFFVGDVGHISKYGPCYSILAKSGSFCNLFNIFNCCDFFSHSQ